MITIPAFSGVNNALAPRLIEVSKSTDAKNCLFRNGNLVALKNNSIETTPALAPNAKSLFLYEDVHWFSWTNVVDAVPSTIAQDQFERVYFTGDGVPKYTNSSIATGGGVLPFASYELGLDNPEAPTVTGITYYDQSADLVNGEDPLDYPAEPASGFINIDTVDDETRFYVCTLVTAYGEESAESLTSTQVELFHPNDSPALSFSDIGGFGNVNITQRRIYRTASSGDITEFFLVAELPVSTATYTDTKQVAELGAQLATSGFIKPPANMQGIISTSNGSIVGFAKNEIIPSEPYLPYAYPLIYRQSLPYDVVALAEMSNGIVAATTDKPVILQGTNPDSYTVFVLDANFPCVSGRSMVDMGEVAMFASHDGLIAVGEGGAKNITLNILHRDYWRSLQPETMVGYRYHDYYIGFYGGVAGFIFNIKTGDYSELDFYGKAGFFDTKTGKLFLCVGDDFVSFDGGANLTYTWHSKEFELTGEKFSCFKVRGNGDMNGSELSIYADDVLLVTYPLNGNIYIDRLPSHRCDKLSFKVVGDAEIKVISLAQSMRELANV